MTQVMEREKYEGRSRMVPVTVVIPALDAARYLPRLLQCIDEQTVLPGEIVIVDTSCGFETREVVERWAGRVPVLYRRIGTAFPGEARNAGVAVAQHPWIAFLDCRTFPYRDWLEKSTGSDFLNDAEFVATMLECKGDTRFKQTLLAATYGQVGVRSLPGSLIFKSAFLATGGFLETVRAGEDIEWLRRVRQSGVKIVSVATPVLSYEGFPSSLRSAVTKWYSYTLSNARIDVLNSQKIIYSSLSFLLCFLFVYRWNDLFAHWRESSIYYVPNITKIFLAVMALWYLLHRGLVRPFKRKVPLCFLLPCRWLEVSLVGFCLDLAKTPGMILGASILLRRRMKRFQRGPVCENNGRG